MRRLTALLMIVFASGPWTRAFAQSCTGLCLQQVTCPNGGTTTVSGVVYAPNGTDPLPNVTVYIPNAPVAAFTPGVSCDVVGAPPSGSPLVGATSAVDGTFTLGDVPVGTNIPLVIVSGRWRRQLVIPATTSCVNTALPSTFAVMPQNQTQGDIPKIAIATGQVDQVECILRKVGLADSEFTDPSGSGRINLYTGSAQSGARIDAATPTQAALMENAATLNSYDVLMLPCQGTPNNNVVSGALGTQELANFISFANAGGRIYSSHYSYAWMYQNPPFDGVANWTVNSGSYPDGTATVNTGFTAGQTLSTWLQDVGASTTAGQIGISTLKHDLNGVIAPTQSWLTLNTTGNPVMQFVFDTPIAPTGTTVNQCGRVLYNEYHVENGSSSPTEAFPAECSSGTTMSPQEKLLEYMLFELSFGGDLVDRDRRLPDHLEQLLVGGRRGELHHHRGVHAHRARRAYRRPNGGVVGKHVDVHLDRNRDPGIFAVCLDADLRQPGCGSNFLADADLDQPRHRAAGGARLYNHRAL
jgi:hypothetical protein